MSRRIDIELTSALADGSYTWRAAGAREPKGVLSGSILPPGTAVGDELKVEVDQMVDGIEVLSVVKGRERGVGPHFRQKSSTWSGGRGRGSLVSLASTPARSLK